MSHRTLLVCKHPLPHVEVLARGIAEVIRGLIQVDKLLDNGSYQTCVPGRVAAHLPPHTASQAPRLNVLGFDIGDDWGVVAHHVPLGAIVGVRSSNVHQVDDIHVVAWNWKGLDIPNARLAPRAIGSGSVEGPAWPLGVGKRTHIQRHSEVDLASRDAGGGVCSFRNQHVSSVCSVVRETPSKGN